MKKFFKSLFVFVLALFICVTLASCGEDNSQELAKLQAEINEYKQATDGKLADYEREISANQAKIIALEEALKDSPEATDYSAKIKSLEDELKSNAQIISGLQNELAAIKNDATSLGAKVDNNYQEVSGKISSIEDSLGEMGGAEERLVHVNLADKYYLVVGDTFQLFYRSVIQAQDPYGYYIRVTGDKGHTFNRYYEFKPETTGTYNLKIEVLDDNGVLLGSDTTKLLVVSNTTTRNKRILVIGDSLTSSGQWIARGVSKFQAAGGTITTIGTVSSSHSSAIGASSTITVKHEGRGGWQWSSFVNKYDSSTKSPFNDGSGLNFQSYLTRNNLERFDEVYILMTFNGFTSTRVYDFSSTFLQSAKTLVDQIHLEFPGVRVTLMSIPLTSTYAGLGSHYEISREYSDNYGIQIRIQEYDNFLEEWTKMDGYAGWLRYVDVKGQFDSEWNMPYENKNVNNTNSSVKEYVGTSMGMHPSSNGYNQIGDAFFRALMSSWGN